MNSKPSYPFHRSLLTGLLLWLCSFIFNSTATAQFYNGSQLAFGKNRVQFTDNFHTFYRFDKFDTYFYTGGKSLAIYTAKYANRYLPIIEKKLDYDLENKIQFVIFNRLSDLKESNIGLVSDEKYNIGGITYIVGSKVFLYYDGDHESLNRQIKAGIARVVLSELMYGEQITAKIKNSTLLTLPDWYTQGLISYMSVNWSTEVDNYVKDGILSGSYEKFNNLTGTNAIYAGHSIWKYIAEKYGEDKISSILYMTRTTKSVEDGFLYVLGVSFKNFTKEWIDYYNKIYERYDKEQSLPECDKFLKKKFTKKVIQQVKYSENGKYLAFVTNDIGQYKVWLYNTEKKKFKRLMKAGVKLDEKTDYSIPVMAWHPKMSRLAIITESKGKIFLYYYNVNENKFEKLRLFDFQKVLDFSFSQNGKLLVMSGVQNGQTDIYVYNLASHTYEHITKDIYDDLNPVFTNNSTNILFSSNRYSDTIKTSSKDSITIPEGKQHIFLYNYAGKNKVLHRITNAPNANETHPLAIDGNHIAYLSDENGITNRFTARLDSNISFIDTTTHYRFTTTSYVQTNYPRSIQAYDINPKKSKCSDIIYANGAYRLVTSNLATEDEQSIELKNTPYMEEYLKDINASQVKTALSTTKAPSSDSAIDKHKKLIFVHQSDTLRQKYGIDINNYIFENETLENNKKFKEINEYNVIAKKDTAEPKSTTKPEFVLPKQLNYDVEYSIDQLVSQVDFSFLNNTYQPFTDVGSPIFINPGFNALFKVGVTDLMEDYRITGGIRFALDFSSAEYILSYENLKYRLDRQILFHRQSMQNVLDNNIVDKNISNEVLYILKWPFSQVLGLKGTALLRNENSVYLATDLNNLEKKDETKNWGGLKAELTFDNTREKGLNIYYGTRWKLFAEVYRQVDSAKQLNVLGFDIRNYRKISRTFIWANRFACSTSFGNQKLVYYMGGVDNWLAPKFNNQTNVATDQNYAYQTLATNMRGFQQNIRNGNSFAVINSELRFPVFRYFINRPLKSEFFSNFQVIGFTDIGTAWTGPNPYSDKNALYTNIVSSGPITVTVTTQKNPIVYGYGFGIRSTIIGYFVRADWAWGVEDGVVNPSIFYLSLGLDF